MSDPDGRVLSNCLLRRVTYSCINHCAIGLIIGRDFSYCYSRAAEPGALGVCAPDLNCASVTEIRQYSVLHCTGVNLVIQFSVSSG